jgi:hypothetical protein
LYANAYNHNIYYPHTGKRENHDIRYPHKRTKTHTNTYATIHKEGKVKKAKLVRDSFTMPKDEYVVIDSLKLSGGKLGQAVKKSELLRAGVKALAAMSDIQFKAALSNVPTIKTGRPTRAK